MRAQSATREDAESRLLLPPSLSAYLCLFLCICFCPSSLACHSSALYVPGIFKHPLGAVVWNAGTTNKNRAPLKLHRSLSRPLWEGEGRGQEGGCPSENGFLFPRQEIKMHPPSYSSFSEREVTVRGFLPGKTSG